MYKFHRKSCHSGAGAALIITLAFIVLLAAVMVIFFTQAISYRMLGNNTVNDFKSAALAQSGLETAVGDLQQELYAGSTAITNNGIVIYTPTGNTNAVPQRSGNPALVSGIDPVPNLVRISVRTETYPTGSPGISSRASADSSTNAAGAGQYISPARWNRHYLIPRANAGTTTIDTTPATTVAPDWVYVTSQGPTVITVANIAAGTRVVGRYAYAIYDEGGLLDANVAGYPSNTATNTAPHPAPNPAGMASWGSGLKGSEAFADLTIHAIGFTQAQVDQLVGWRNNATAQPTGSYNSYAFTSAAALRYHDAVVTSTNGFLMTSGGTWTDPNSGKIDTDQVFPSRQALIAFINDAGMPQDALQYMGTFTRDLEQPCYNPPVGRPQVQNSAANNKWPSGTGNDAYNSDRASATTNSPTDINPPLLAVRVATSFTRPDTSTAQVGEPLLKKRFPLSRLNLITSSSTATQSQTDPIYRNFGLYRSDATKPWMYNHDASNTTGIDRLNAVASLQREPDFFELLKAAINVGSIGKGACYATTATWTDIPGTDGALQQARDNLTNLQILQIGANIIDQAKADNFPTRIQFSGDPTLPPNEVRGSEDLPYLYRYRNWFTQCGTTGSVGAFLLQPELWDPYSPGSSSLVAANATPTTFRVRAAADPSLASTATPVILAVAYNSAQNTFQDNSAAVTFNYPNSPPTPVTFNAGEINGYWGFREPTLLGQIGVPASSNVTGDAYTDFKINVKLTGLLLGTFPEFNPIGAPTDWAYKIGTSNNGNASIRFYLEYQDASGNWITYDEQPFEFPGFKSFTIFYPSATKTYPVDIANSDYLGATRTDPRTSRWGYFYGEYMYDLPVVDMSNAEFGSYRADGEISFGTHMASRLDAGFDANQTLAYANRYRGFEHGYWAENSLRGTFQPPPSLPGNTFALNDPSDPPPYYRYNRDPDGVPRRAIGGYVTDTSNGGKAAQFDQPLTGLPMAIGKGTVNNIYQGTTTSADPNNPPYSSRPTILHRPFRSVAELGYVFRETPWGNINFTFPESGDAALLDVFCVNETSDPNGMVAGRLNLNTHQAPVIAAMLSGTLRDKDDSTCPVLSPTMGLDLGKQLVTRTSNPGAVSYYGPLASRAALVGTWIGSTTTTAATTALNVSPLTTLDNSLYTGFSYDIGTSAVPSVNNPGNGNPAVALIPRQRDAVMRALADAGTTRTWNLLIDLVAQSGRFPPKSTAFSNYVVEGEKHYWLHVAIDRYTGKILDSQLEVVRE